MENSKKNYILKSNVKKVITYITRVLWISLITLLIYPQTMCKSSEISVDKKIAISAKVIKKDLNYIKEDIKLPVLINGRNENKIKNINKVIYDDIIPKLTEAESAAKDRFNVIEEKPAFPYEVISSYIISKENNAIISLYNDYYEYLGGAHGSTIRTSYTIDKNSEEILQLKDLFLEGYDYRQIINNQIREEIRKDPDKYFYSSDNFKGISDNQKYYLSDGNIIIYYEQYEIAPYVAGIPEFKIPIEKFEKNIIYRA